MQNPEDQSARAQLNAAADAGCLPAKVWVAWWMTFDPKPEFEGVREQLTAAAKDQYAPAAFALGRMHEPGDRMLPDLAKSREWYSRAHDLGDWDALFALQDLPPKPLSELTLDELWEQYTSEPSELAELHTDQGVCWLRP
jgi:TPR repeat protein